MVAGTIVPKYKESFWDKTLNDPVAAFTGILSVATIGLFFFTFRLWRTTYELSVEAKATGADQADKMERSVAEAARSATAMEGVAKSMAINANQIVESVRISRDIAMQQQRFGEAQLRAYISVLIGGATYQEPNGVFFDASPMIVNKGNTPARDIRYRINAAVLPSELPDNFHFPMPKRVKDEGSNVLGSTRRQDGCRPKR